jgi:cytidylate kinase
MGIRIVTFEREYGSGCSAIAATVARRLGWKLWDQALSEEIARRLHCRGGDVERLGERSDPALYRLFKSFLRGSFEGSLNAPRLGLVDAESIRAVVSKLVPELAEAGNCVIVGRAAAFLLRERRDAFHVFVYAPFKERVRRLREAGESEQKAEELAQTVDRERADFILKRFGIEWPGRHYFHLAVNSCMGDDPAAEIILHALAVYKERC